MACMLALGACSDDRKETLAENGEVASNANSTMRKEVLVTNANIAHAVYADSLITAQNLRNTLEIFVNDPNQDNFAAAKQAWLDSREPYGQTEVYRFREGPIDALKDDGSMGDEGDGPEGAINAWPLGEAMIDYVAVTIDGSAEPEDPANSLTTNIIADVDTYPTLDKETILSLAEYGEDERNVSTGYHAIEFLLWGQDLNEDLSAGGMRDSSAGQRPVTDFHTAANGFASSCTSGAVKSNDQVCSRRGDYLLAAADLLIDHLRAVSEAWDPNGGVHYKSFVAGGDASLAKILEGMGRLSFGELAGERINIALTTDSQEDEHSCFSDNTHRDIFLNALGIQNTYLGTYTKVNGEVVAGTSPRDLLIAEGSTDLANELQSALETTMAKAAVIDDKAKNGMPFDMLIQQGVNQADIKAVINALVAQTDDIEQAIKALKITTNDLQQDTEQDIGG